MRRRMIVLIAVSGLILSVAVGTAIAQATQRFDDVPTDHEAFEAVEWAAETGLTLGYGDGTFRPDLPLHKTHALIFMERYYDNILGAAESDEFTLGDMMMLLKAINDAAEQPDEATPPTTTTAPTTSGAEGPGDWTEIVDEETDWGGYLATSLLDDTLSWSLIVRCDRPADDRDPKRTMFLAPHWELQWERETEYAVRYRFGTGAVVRGASHVPDTDDETSDDGPKSLVRVLFLDSETSNGLRAGFHTGEVLRMGLELPDRADEQLVFSQIGFAHNARRVLYAVDDGCKLD